MPRLGDIGSAIVRRRYLRNVCMEAAKRGIRIPSRAQLMVEGRELETYPGRPASDAAGKPHLAMAALVLATYRELEHDLPDSAARVELLKQALLDAYRSQLRMMLRLALGASRDRFRLLTRTFASERVEQQLFGSEFEFNRRDRGASFDLVINRCLYHRFFDANGAPELTPVICHSDHAWIDEIDPAKHGVRFSRPTTLGWGDPECVFRFQREPADPD